MEHNFERLKAHILPLSRARHFDAARLEWELIGVELSEEWDACPCGQPIKEHCFIQNKLTGERTHVGNVCINRFMGIETGNLFDGLRRIAADPQANANLDVIEHAQKLGYLFENEYPFLVRTRLKRKLTNAQLAWKEKINRRITNKTVVRRRSRLTGAT